MKKIIALPIITMALVACSGDNNETTAKAAPKAQDSVSAVSDLAKDAASKAGDAINEVSIAATAIASGAVTEVVEVVAATGEQLQDAVDSSKDAAAAAVDAGKDAAVAAVDATKNAVTAATEEVIAAADAKTAETVETVKAAAEQAEERADAAIAAGKEKVAEAVSAGADKAAAVVGAAKNQAAQVVAAGDYHGILPCADCSGVSTILSLDADGGYELSQHYERVGEKTKVSTGKIVWQDDIAQIGANFYKITADAVYLLDADKKVHQGADAAKYKLVKTELQQQIDANVGYNLKQFVGEDGSKIDVVFNTNKKPATASFSLAGELLELPQVEAWAHGARYENDKVKVKFQNDTAEVSQGDKTVKYTAK